MEDLYQICKESTANKAKKFSKFEEGAVKMGQENVRYAFVKIENLFMKQVVCVTKGANHCPSFSDTKNMAVETRRQMFPCGWVWQMVVFVWYERR